MLFLLHLTLVENKLKDRSYYFIDSTDFSRKYKFYNPKQFQVVGFKPQSTEERNYINSDMAEINVNTRVLCVCVYACCVGG